MLEASFDKNKVSFKLLPTDSLTNLGFALQIGLEWLLGSGCWAIELIRSPAPPQHFRFILRGKSEAKQVAFSKAATIKTLCDGGYLPKSIPAESSLQPTDANLVKMGQERIGARKEYTVFKTQGIPLELPMSEICYGNADLCIELMKMKATTIDIVISAEGTEIG